MANTNARDEHIRAIMQQAPRKQAPSSRATASRGSTPRAEAQRPATQRPATQGTRSQRAMPKAQHPNPQPQPMRVRVAGAQLTKQRTDFEPPIPSTSRTARPNTQNTPPSKTRTASQPATRANKTTRTSQTALESQSARANKVARSKQKASTKPQKPIKKTQKEPRQINYARYFSFLGWTLFVVGGLAFASTLSYFSHWRMDADMAQPELLWSGTKSVAANLMGSRGAIISQLLIGEWFGVLGILAPVVVLLCALRLVGVKGYKLFRSSLSLLLLITVGSIGFGHFAGADPEIFGSGWGGAMGIYVARWFEIEIGYWGMSFVFLVLAVAVLYYVFYDHVRTAVHWYRKTMEVVAQKRALKLQQAALDRETRLLQIQEQRAQIALELAQYTQEQNTDNNEFTQQTTTEQDQNNEDNHPQIAEEIDCQGNPTQVEQSAEGENQNSPLSEGSTEFGEGINTRDSAASSQARVWQRNPGYHYVEFEDGQLAVVTSFGPEHTPEDYMFLDLEAMDDYTLVDITQPLEAQNDELAAATQETQAIELEQEENPFELVERDENQQVTIDNPEESAEENTQATVSDSNSAPKSDDAVTEDVQRATVTMGESAQDTSNETSDELPSVTTQAQTVEPTSALSGISSTEPKMHIHYTSEVALEQSAPQDNIIIEQTQSEEQFSTAQIDHQPLFDPTRELSGYHKPTLGLLTDHQSNVVVSEEELIDNKNRIVSTLETFGIRIDTIEVVVGPTITLYEIIPAPGIRISKIKNLEDDIAMALSALGIRIIAPIPGKGTIGIEVPNKQKNIVSMHSVIRSAKFQNSKAALPVALGKTIQDETFVFDLAKMPHLLVAGATGQGKSVGLNAIITSLIYQKHPSELKFILIDPKKVELTLYAKLENHFLAKIPDADEAIITDNQKVIYTLNSICIEMDDRYQLLKDARVRSIKEYNDKFAHHRLNPEKGHRFLPYFVVVIDEFADLIMTSGREIETPIARIAQLARAVGIHLIIATQRPTTNIITGVIKANFPARIAFRVTSQIDSRTILDQTGANQLVGQGDMLVSTGNEVTRVQCAFVDTPEVENIVDYIAEQVGFDGPLELPDYQPETPEGGSREESSLASGKRDALFGEVAHYVVANGQCSASTIQRKFSIGFNRAGRIVDQLEASGIVGGAQGSKPRQVLISDPMTVEDILGYN